PEDRRDRLAASHGKNAAGKLIVSDDPAKSSFLKKPTLLMPGGGLVSTARDYARFCQMLLNGGQLDGKRVLKAETVRLMTSNQLPAEAMPLSIVGARLEGVGFGLGFSVRVAASRTQRSDRVGEYGWGGAATTHFSVSPRDDMFVISLEQFQPVNPVLWLRLKPL